jgi:hypothetical protein
VFLLKLKEIADAAFSSGERDNGNGEGHAVERVERSRKVA